MSTFTTNLSLIEPGVNDPATNNVWGSLLNTDWQLVDDYTAGILSLSVAGNLNIVLTSVQGASDQSRRAHYVFTGALTGDIVVLWPQGLSRVFSVFNNTTGPHALAIGANNGAGSAGGSTVAVPQGQTVVAGSDGTNGFLRTTGAGLGAFLVVNNLSEGVATTMRTNLGLGSIATQAASAVAITGGTITGTTVSGLTVTSSTGTLTVTNLKTLSVSNSLTLAGTDGTTMTFPGTNATIARTDAANTFTGTQTFSSAPVFSDQPNSRIALGITNATINLGTPTGSTNLSAAHGLAAEPMGAIFYIQCTSADLNYSVGDRAFVSFGGGSLNDNGTGWWNATNVGFNIAVNGIKIVNSGTNGGASINTAKWTMFAFVFSN